MMAGATVTDSAIEHAGALIAAARRRRERPRAAAAPRPAGPRRAAWAREPEMC